MNACLALDIGGSFIKLGLMDEACAPLAGDGSRGVRQVPIDSSGSAADIFAALEEALLAGMRAAREAGASLSAISASIPGPFDYERGISRMRHKLAAIEGVELMPRMQRITGDVPLLFLHDSTAFLLGEACYGTGRGSARPVGVMLGTGFGFAVMQGGRVCVSREQTPALSLWARPLRDGITEDYVSARAIRARYAKRRGDADAPSVREIALRARQGDSAASQTLVETGRLMAEALMPHLTALRCDRMILGGQIAWSADLITPGFAACCDTPLCVAAHLEDAALRGAAHYARYGRAACVAETTEADMLAFAQEED